MYRLSLLIFAAVFAMLATAANGADAPAPPKTVLYVFAHEDDELDVVAKIVSDMRAGKDVYAAWVTSGDKGADPATRLKETGDVMELLKVPKDHLFFLGYPDQFAFEHLKEIYRDLLKIAENIGPAEIMSHAYEGSNIDHDTVAFTSAMVAKKLGAVHYEFPDTNMYKGQIQVWKFIPREGAEVLYTPMDKNLYKLKMSVMKMYPSQASGLNAYDLVVDKAQLKKFGEPYRVAPDYDYTKPPADELRYSSTSKGTATLEIWLKAVDDFFADFKD
jgi:LmbE family N-acetylglucosaminyl deacetylase